MNRNATSSFSPNFDELEKMLDLVIAGESEEEAIDDLAIDVGEVESQHQVLAQFASTSIELSEDGLSAYIYGTLPPDLDLQSTTEMLKGAGINYGIQEEVILDALAARTPYKSRKERRRKVSAAVEKRRWEVACGLPPEEPQPARIEWVVPLVEGGEQLQTLLWGNDLAAIERYRTALPLVRPGQVLVRLREVPGRPGTDVQGRQIPCRPTQHRQLPAGEYVEVDEGGQCCRAAMCGYAALIDGNICIIPPMWIAPDNMRVVFVQLPHAEGDAMPKVEDLVALLEYFYIGMRDESTLAKLCEELAKGVTKTRLLLLARGTPPVPGTPATWGFTFPTQQAFYFEQLAFLLRVSRNVNDLREGAKNLGSRCVEAGEVIAIRVEMRSGVAGVDVFGEEIEPERGVEIKIELGGGVSLSEDGLSCCADLFGYVGLSGNEMRVVSPLWVSSDAMVAYYVSFLQLGARRAPTLEDINAMLRANGVRHGIDEDAAAILCEKMRQRLPVDTLVPLARGTEPTRGGDAQIDFALDMERKAGVVREDGSIDFKAGQNAPQVLKGQLLASLQTATHGAKGRDARGEERPSAGDGRPLQVDAGKNVLHVVEEGTSLYRAQIDGELQVEQRGDIVQLAVSPVLFIHGDVDYATGNIEFDGSVRVTGVVKSGFSVTATDDIVIGDYIDTKGSVCAGGRVAVLHGVTGEGSRIQAGSSVQVKFLNAAYVKCKGNLVVDEYIYNAEVHCGGSIFVYGHHDNRKSGAIVGGRVVAAHKIRAVNIGTDTGAATVVVAGIDMDILAELRRHEALIARSHEVVRQMKMHLGIESLNPHDIKKVITRFSGDRKQRITDLVKKMAAVLKQQREAEGRKKECQERMAKMVRGARINVDRKIASNAQVRLGELSPRAGLYDGLEGVSLYVREESGRPRIDVEALRE